MTSHDERDSQCDKGPDKSRETEKKVTAQKEDSLTSDCDHDSQHDEDPDKSMQTKKNDTAQKQDPLHSDHHDGHKSMESGEKNTEIMFSDNNSDGESEIDNDKQLKEVIDTLADETIENLAVEAVSKYYTPKTNERLEADKKLSTVVSSDLDSGDEDNFSLAKLKALNQLKETLLENTPMSMEEYWLRNEETLDSRTIHKKFVKSNTESSITEATPIDSDDSLTASTSYTLSNSDDANGTDPGQSTGSTNIKSDTTFSNDRESDSSGEMIVITRKKKRRKQPEK